jgi:predicted enzyme related to lactoylglutathione lyase
MVPVRKRDAIASIRGLWASASPAGRESPYWAINTWRLPIDETLEKLRKRGAQLVGEVVRYKDAYRLCYIRSPEGLLIGLAQELS